MSSPVAKLVFRAALLATPLYASAQFHPGVPDRTANLTLLTGPGLTSPAGQRTLTTSGWSLQPPAEKLTTVSTINSGTLSLSSSSRFSGVTTLTAGTFTFVPGDKPAVTDAELTEARQALEAAKARLEKLQAERDQAAARKNASGGTLFLRPNPAPAVADPLRFDAIPIGVPTDLKWRGTPVRTGTGIKRD
jgi:autotransporter-associated beta strand protein